MIEQITMFRTSDGKTHDSQLEAQTHDRNRFMKTKLRALVNSELNGINEDLIADFIFDRRVKILSILTYSGDLT